MSPNLVSIFAQISACNARVAGMQAANAQRALIGESVAYAQDAFDFEAAELDRLSLAAREA